MPKSVQLYWLQVIEYPHREILTNTAAPKYEASEVNAHFKWLSSSLHVASGTTVAVHAEII
jgi:hypothetical protein